MRGGDVAHNGAIGGLATLALALVLGLASGALGCGQATGAGPLKGGGGTLAFGGSSANGGSVQGGAAGHGGTSSGLGGSGQGGTLPPVADPFQPPGDEIDTWSGKLPPGGLLDPDTTVYFPKSVAPDAKLPLVVFAHGDNLTENEYADTFRHIAKFGYVVSTVEYDWNPLDTDHHAAADSMLKAIDLLTNNPPGKVGAIVDGSRIAAMGHGLGGKSAIWMALEGAAIHAVVALDPIDDAAGIIPSNKRPSLTPEMMGSMAVPALYLATQFGPTGITNCVPRASNGCRFHEATPAGKSAWIMVLQDFGLRQFVDGYNCLACLGCARGDQNFHGPTQLAARGLTVAFLEYVLRGKTGYLAYLEGAQLEALRQENRVLDAQEQFAFCAEQ